MKYIREYRKWVDSQIVQSIQNETDKLIEKNKQNENQLKINEFQIFNINLHQQLL